MLKEKDLDFYINIDKEFADLLENTLKKNERIARDLELQGKKLIFAKEVRKAIKDEFNFLLLSLILENENISFSEIVKDLKNNPLIINSKINKLSELGLIEIEFKENSPLQPYYKISEYGKKILEGFGVTSENIDNYLQLAKEKKIKERIEELIP